MLNTDASLCSNINIRGLGGVFLNRLGDWVMGFTAPTIAQDITNLEFLALSISNATWTKATTDKRGCRQPN